MHRRHRNDKAEQIINNRVQKPIKQSFLRHVLHRFQPIIDVQLGSHLDESEHVYAADQSVQDEGVPAFVLLVEQRVDCVADDQRIHSIAHVLHCILV